MIRESRYQPDIIIAVGRGGTVVSRLLCDFMGVDTLLLIPIKWVETYRKPGEKYLADLVRGCIKASKEGRPFEEYIKDVVSKLKTIVSVEYTVNLSNHNVLLVEEISATGMHLSLAKNIVENSWKAREVKTATLIWKSTTSTIKLVGA